MASIENLYWKCLGYIRENLFQILTIYESKNVNLKALFAGFPPTVCESLLRYMAPDVQPEIICYFFRTGTKIVDLFSYQHNIPLQGINEICEGITSMNLAFSRLSLDNINILVKHLPNVIVLNLCHTTTTDSILETIGVTCSLLESLNLSDCAVTDNGLYYLCCESDKKQTKCKNLKVLNAYNTEITARGLFYMLSYHYLWEVYVDTNILMLAIYEFMCCHFDRQLNLQNLYLMPVTNSLDLEDILSRTWRLKSLFSYKSQLIDSDLINVPKFNYLQRLSLSVEKGGKKLTFEGVIQFLSVSGKKLTELKLNNFEYVNLFLIGLHCSNLQFLSLYSIRHLHFNKKEFTELNSLFGSLTFLNLYNLRGNPWDDCLLLLFMNCPKLNYLSLSSSSCFTENVIFESIPFLNSVKRLHISNCKNINKDVVHMIIDNLPNLKCLSLEFKEGMLSADDIKKINDKLKFKTSAIFHHFRNVNENETSERSVNLEQMKVFFETVF
ncbi:uncharacterized protein [Centruroides vittatus]|uniref:uncharacterized protein n=1 Tax=Centruroides vittatus TaxID=120091 RepID=UPI00350FC76A